MLTVLLVILSACGENPKAEHSTAKESTPKIIAGTVVIAEILDQLNIDAIAVPETSKQLPKRFEGLPTIGNAMEPDMEIVKSLAPTSFLSVSTLEYDLVDRFEQLNIPAQFLNFQSIDSMIAEIDKLGQTYERKEEAEKFITAFQQKVEEVSKATQTDSPKVLILLGIPGSYLVATEHSYTGDLVTRAGGINAMQGMEMEYLPSNTEYLHESNPDIILRLAHGMPDEVVKMFNEEFKTNDIWKHFDAVKNDRVYDLDEERFGTTASLLAPEALQQLQEIFEDAKEK